MKQPTKPKKTEEYHREFPNTIAGLKQVLQQPDNMKFLIHDQGIEVWGWTKLSDGEHRAALQKYEADLLEYKKRRLEKLKRELGDGA